MTQLSLDLTAPEPKRPHVGFPRRRAYRILTVSVAFALTGATFVLVATIAGGIWA